jgi:hypothetical protein
MSISEKQPNFFVVGTVKGGTTSIHRYLSNHPQIYMSPIKEVNYFSDEFINKNNFAKDYKHDINVNIEKYLAGDRKHPVHIAHIADQQTYNKLFDRVENQKAIGEMSLSYMLYGGVAEKIFNFNPNSKIVMILRDPAERAFSQYIMNLKQGKILTQDFLKEIRQDDDRSVKGWGANHQYLQIGKYYKQVKNYLDVFPKNQVKIILYDDYKKDAAATIKDLFEFLNVEKEFQIDTTAKYNESGISRFSRLNYFLNHLGIIGWLKRLLPYQSRAFLKKILYAEKNIPQMSLEERKWLVEYYREDIMSLQKLVNLDLSPWMK